MLKRLTIPLLLALLAGASACTPKVPPKPPEKPKTCEGVVCPEGVPCRDGICHVKLEACGDTFCQVTEKCQAGKCVPKEEPPPPPEPTKEPKYLEMLLRTCGTGQFCQNGNPIDFAGCEACCMPFEGGRSGWPLFSSEFLTYCQEKGRANFLHARPGPFLVADEPEWASFGGAYVEVEGKADLTKWNEPFWVELERSIDEAGSKGVWVEIDLIDSWRLKGGCDYSPWVNYRNIQGENHCANTHRGPGDSVHDAYLKKLLETIGRFGNVIFQIGNESGLVAGKNQGLKDWERWVRDRVRHWEAEVAFNVVHMVGTNSEFDEIEASDIPDYINWHGQIPREPAYGKPTTNNETNPAPGPSAYLSLYCGARKGGAYFWAWRSELPQPEWEAVLGLISEARLTNCEGVETGACPYQVPPTHTISCKPHAPWQDGWKWDCTPRTTTGPVWPEGESGEVRAACEQKSMGGTPTYSLQGPTGDLSLRPLGNPMQFALRGFGKATLHCTIPAAPGKELCGYQVSR